MCKVTALPQLTEFSLPELFAQGRLVQRILRDDLLLSTATDLFLAVSEGAFIPVTAGSRL